jgi:very-short-patch-repair endonuclease
MATLTPQSRAKRAWLLAARQHGVIAHFQLVALGFTESAIRWRVAEGRLHRVHRGVYAVGRPNLTRKGEWMAAVLACGPTGALSHETSAALWGIRSERRRDIHVSVAARADRRHRGIVVHRRSVLRAEDITRREGIPVTTAILTLIDLATRLPAGQLEAAINEADKLDLITPLSLRKELDHRRGQRGIGPLKAILDRSTFVLTDSDLERYFLPIAARAGLPRPQTQRHLNGSRVDFYWRDLGLVVETDGLRYHRTAEQQLKDRVRDQAHAAAGLTPLRFTHWQVRYHAAHVEGTLRAVARRLSGARPACIGRTAGG